MFPHKNNKLRIGDTQLIAPQHAALFSPNTHRDAFVWRVPHDNNLLAIQRGFCASGEVERRIKRLHCFRTVSALDHFAVRGCFRHSFDKIHYSFIYVNMIF